MSDKKNKKLLVPERRFPGFKGEWEVPTLGDISERVTERVGDRALQTVSISAGIGFVSQAQKFSRDISGEQYKNYTVLKKGEFSYNKGNSKRFPQGCVYKLKEFDKVAAPNVFISFRFNKGYVGDFFQGYFENNFHGEQLKQHITSGARSNGLLNISADSFFGIRLPTPRDVKEQQKIANCLLSLEEMITAQEQKTEALRDHKKALMQSLFPGEGQSTPELRFSGFKEKWSREHGNALFYQISNKQHDSTLPILAITQEHGAIPRNQIDYHVSVSEKSIEGYKVVEIGDFIISLRSFQGGIEYSNYKGICSPAYVILRKRDDLSAHYFRHFFKFEGFIKNLTKNLEGLRDGKMISYAQFSELIIPFPSSIKEQQKIADCLSSVDDKIAIETQKLDTFKEHKKGLIQQLFPALETVEER